MASRRSGYLHLHKYTWHITVLAFRQTGGWHVIGIVVAQCFECLLVELLMLTTRNPSKLVHKAATIAVGVDLIPALQQVGQVESNTHP